MAVVLQTSAPITWFSINVTCMIVVVRAPGVEDSRIITAHNRPFVIPFVRHRESPEPVQMSQSLRSPDGAMEIMGIAELNEQRPETLLAQFHEFYEQYGSRYKKPIETTKNFFQKLFGK